MEDSRKTEQEKVMGIAEKDNSTDVKERAKRKLEKELENAKDRAFSKPIIEHLLERCGEDTGLSEDVLQEHKTYDKCFECIYDKVQKQAKSRICFVDNDVVYEWAEDYYHRDDKAEEEAGAKKEAGAKAERKKAAAEKKPGSKDKPGKKEDKAGQVKEPAPEKAGKTREQPKPKKNSRVMDGQLDLFSMMGM